MMACLSLTLDVNTGESSPEAEIASFGLLMVHWIDSNVNTEWCCCTGQWPKTQSVEIRLCRTVCIDGYLSIRNSIFRHPCFSCILHDRV